MHLPITNLAWAQKPLGVSQDHLSLENTAPSLALRHRVLDIEDSARTHELWSYAPETGLLGSSTLVFGNKEFDERSCLSRQ